MTVNQEHIAKVAREIFLKHEFLDYLKLSAKNPGLSALNNLVLWQQRKHPSGVIAGEMVWEHIGVDKKGPAFILTLPVIVKNFGKTDAVEYEPIRTFESGITVSGSAASIPDAVVKATGFILVVVPKDKADRRIRTMGINLDDEAQVIYIYESLEGERLHERLLSTYIDYNVYIKCGEFSNLASTAVKYAVNCYFRLENKSIKEMLFQNAAKLPDEELLDFLQKIHAAVFDVIHTMNGEIALTFDETAILNQILRSDDPEDLINYLSDMHYSHGLDPLFDSIIAALLYKIRQTPEAVKRLYQQMQTDGCLYSYPAVVLKGENEK